MTSEPTTAADLGLAYEELQRLHIALGDELGRTNEARAAADAQIAALREALRKAAMTFHYFALGTPSTTAQHLPARWEDCSLPICVEWRNIVSGSLALASQRSDGLGWSEHAEERQAPAETADTAPAEPKP